MNAVIEAAKEEHYETAINTLYQRYPILNDVLNYYIAMVILLKDLEKFLIEVELQLMMLMKRNKNILLELLGVNKEEKVM